MKEIGHLSKNAGICIPIYTNRCRKSIYQCIPIGSKRGKQKNMHSCAMFEETHNTCNIYELTGGIC